MAKKRSRAAGRGTGGTRRRAGRAAVPTVSGQRALAAAIGVSPATAARYVARDDWPVDRRGPWSAADVDRVKHWQTGLQEDRAAEAADDAGGTADLSLMSRAKLAVLIERAAALKLERGIRSGEYGRKAEFFRDSVRVIMEVRDLFLALPKQLALPLVGQQDPAAIEAILTTAIRDVLHTLASQREGRPFPGGDAAGVLLGSPHPATPAGG